jgi:raffinose/stachyose/melibiose transport system permease protein
MGDMSVLPRLFAREKIEPRERHRPLILNHGILLLLVAFAVLPLLILVFNAVKSNAEIGSNPLGIPLTLHLENFGNAWAQGEFATTAGNSAILVVSTVSLILILAGMASYGLARRKPPGSDIFMFYMLVASTIPIWLYIVPLFFLWRTLGLINTRIGLVIIYTALNSPFAIFLLRSYMLALSSDFEDAARVDGANEFQVLTRIVVPLTWPGFLTVGLIVGLGVWSEFQVALIFVNDPTMFPVTTSFFKFTDRFSRDWSLTSAGAVLMIFPVLLLFLALQRRFVEGITQGGIKI